MQNVLEVLFPYLFLLYVLDCITYIKAPHVLLVSLFGMEFGLKRSGICLTGLLPTSQSIITCNLPIHYTPDGIYLVFDTSCPSSRIDKAEDFNYLAYREIQFVEFEGKNIKLNNQHMIKTPSSSSAQFNANFINQLKALGPSERKRKVRTFLADSFDLNAIKQIVASHSKSFLIIKIISSYLFVLVFLLLPMALYSNLSEYIHLDALAICIFFFYVLLVLVAFLTLKKLAKFDNSHRSHILLSIIFSPVNAIHVLGYLTKDLFAEFNHLAVAAHFLPRDAFKELLRKEIFLLDHFENEIARRDWQMYWRLKRELLIGLLDQCGISYDEILTPPEKKDQTAIRYCPVCMTEYRQPRHECIDCGVVLKEFAEMIEQMVGADMNQAESHRELAGSADVESTGWNSPSIF